MKIYWHRNFEKHYKKRILPYPNIKSRFEERIKLFRQNPKDPILKDHKLTGKLGRYRAFWIAGNIRVSYRVRPDGIEFYDVGSHPQVY